MFDQIEKMITEQTARAEDAPERTLLSDVVPERFSEMLRGIARTISQSTVTQMLVRQVGDDNPFAAFDPALLTDEQRMRAERAVNEALNSGATTLPKPLTDLLAAQLGSVTDAFLEMIGRVFAHRGELSVLLPGGKPFTRIEDMVPSAGDTHNQGRSVTVLVTDTGKLVYKPRDMRGEAAVSELVRALFSDVLGIPRCVAVGRDFGVSEFIGRERSEGEEEARLFWRRMGGASAVFKILGSTDMHTENLTCSGGRPYVIDLETVFSPEQMNEAYGKLHPELRRLKSSSPYLSGLLPFQHDDRELSVLMNTGDDGCAPIVGGRRVTVRGYLADYKAGYEEIYRRILEHKDDISRFVSALSAETPVRILIRNTQFYHDTMLKLWRHGALADVEAASKARELLEKRLRLSIRDDCDAAVLSETRHLARGDIPYFYTFADGADLSADGGTVVSGLFGVSAAQHIRNTLDALGEEDLSFDLQLLTRAVGQYPDRLPEDERGAPVRPVRADVPLGREEALAEAKRQFGLIFDLAVEGPDGKLFWGYTDGSDYSFRFCETGFANGLTGVAVFAAACAFAAGGAETEEAASRVVKEAVTELERYYGYYEENDFPEDQFPNLGEADGMGGILNGLALLRRYTDGVTIRAMQEKALLTISRYGLSRYGAPDRMAGIAGLLSALCRFDEYRTDRELIASAADRLLALKTLPRGNGFLWMSFPDRKRAISGGGHGLAGIAEALCAADAVLCDGRYARAAEDAIRFELEAYDEKIGTWSDLRSYPPTGYMHGYCSGAPGIGIMVERIGKAGFHSDEFDRCAYLAGRSTDSLPLNPRDHLCCGNAAIAEYYMTAGRHDEAGRVLAAMRRRSAEDGSYRYMAYDCHNGVTPSLFYGASGIGYEMLRYACPEKILPVI